MSNAFPYTPRKTNLDPTEAINTNRCAPCGLHIGSFRNDASEREYTLTARCQSCQDETMSDTNKQDLETIDALSALGRTLIRTEGWHFSGKELITKVIRAALREQWATAYEAAALFDVAIEEDPGFWTWDPTTPCLDALDQGAAGRATPEEEGAYYSTFNAAIKARA